MLANWVFLISMRVCMPIAAALSAICGSESLGIGGGKKNMHWHIDYLRSKADYLGEVILPGSPKEMECALVSELLRIPAAGYGVIGFGSSDCRCPSHLIYVPTARPKQA